MAHLLNSKYYSRMSAIVYIILLITPSFVLGAGDCPPERLDPELSMEAKLHSDLFCGYDKDYRPVKNHSKPVDVYVRMSLKYFTFDEASNSLSVYSWIVLKWTDEFLSWNPKDYGNIDEMVVESSNVWTPILSLLNAHAESWSEEFHTDCLLTSQGEVTCVPEITHTAVCVTKLKNWPYDTQNCTLRLGAWMHSGEQINYKLYNSTPALTSDAQPGSGWKLLSVAYLRHAGIYDCCPNQTYPSIRFYLIMKRIESGPAAVIVIPSLVLVLLTLTSMLLDAKNAGRIILACFSLLGHFIFLTELANQLPRHSEDTPVILLFLRDSMLVTIAVIVITVILSCIMSKVRTPPLWVARGFKIFESGFGNYIVFTEFDPTKPKQDDQENLTSAKERDQASEWTLVCNAINSILFVIFLLTYIILLATKMPYGNSELV